MSEDHWFDPADFPHGVVCGVCSVPLTQENVIRVDVTDEPDTQPWERTPPDQPRVELLQCVDCTINNRVAE